MHHPFTICEGKRLIEITRRKANERIGLKDSLLAEKSIDIVPLQLSMHSRNLDSADNLGHCYRRKEILKMYNQTPEGDVSYCQLFLSAKDEAVKQSKIYCSNNEAKEKYITVYGNRVGITGQAGIGKTTLTKVIAKEMLNEGLFGVDFIFYLKCCDIDCKKTSNLLDFLINSASEFTKHESKLILKLLNDSQKVGIILDGFDEVAFTENLTLLGEQCCSINDIKNAETFIKNLLSGNILPNAKVLVTSRPQQLLQLHEDCKPKFIVEIAGLDKDGQRQICHDICNGKEQQERIMLDYLHAYPNLQAYCYVPINCILVMLAVFLSIQKGGKFIADSITSIFVATLYLFINRDYLRGTEFQLKNICFLAFRGFMQNKIIFTKEDLEEANITTETATTFFTTSNYRFKEGILEGFETSRIYFSHLMLQEFFVALYLFLFGDKKELQMCVEKLTKNKYELVSKFLFGLCNSTTLDYLQTLVPSNIIDLASIEAKKRQLKDFVVEQLTNDSNQLMCDQNSNSLFVQISAWVYEMRDKEFSERVAYFLRNREIRIGSMIPSDIPAFHYMIGFMNSVQQSNSSNMSLNKLEDNIQAFSSQVSL